MRNIKAFLKGFLLIAVMASLYNEAFALCSGSYTGSTLAGIYGSYTQALAACNAHHPTYGCSSINGTFCQNSGADGCYWTTHCDPDGTAPSYHHFGYYTAGCPNGEDPGTGECVEQCQDPGTNPNPVDMVWSTESCQYEFISCNAEYPGVSKPITETPGAAVGDTACVGGCVFILQREVLGQGQWAASDSSCSGEAQGPEYQTPGTACVWDANGNVACFEDWIDPGPTKQCGEVNGSFVCTEEGKTNCGSFNGEYVCVESIPDGACGQTGSGAQICWDGTEPATENPLTPNIEGETQKTDGSTADFDFYSKDNITTNGGATAQPGDAPGVGEEPPQTVTVDTGTGEPPTDEPEMPELGEHPDLPTETLDFADAPTWSSGIEGAGQCPAPLQISYAGISKSYSFQEICDYASYLRALVLAVAGFAAALIVWRAV